MPPTYSVSQLPYFVAKPQLTITKSKPADSAVKRLPPDPDRPTYKPLPEGWQDSPRYWFYGWAVNDKILRTYLLKINSANASGSPIAVAGIAFHCIKCQSGYPHIGFVGGKPDNESISQGRVIQTEVGPQLDLFAISCTRSKRLFHRRPTKKQLAKLVEIFGEEPRWFEDVLEKKNFDKHSIP